MLADLVLVLPNVKCMQRPQIFSCALRIANLGMWHTQCYVSAHFIISALFFPAYPVSKYLFTQSSYLFTQEKHHFYIAL